LFIERISIYIIGQTTIFSTLTLLVGHPECPLTKYLSSEDFLETFKDKQETQINLKFGYENSNLCNNG